MGAVAALALGGCKSSTAPNCSASTALSTGSGALWVGRGFQGPPPDFGWINTIQGYTANQLASSSSAAPAVVLTLGGDVSPTVTFGLAFDASGNLWVGYFGAVVEYTACQLTAGGSPKPNVTLTANAAGSLNNPVALAFDARGNLWVADELGGPPGGNTRVEFTPSQLAASGSPTPAVTLSAINNPVGLAFDHSGNLWTSIPVAPDDTSSTLVEFSASQLTASGTPTPAVTLSSNGSGSLSGPSGLAFDRGGNLWITNTVNGGSIEEFASSQLGSTGSPTPAVTLTGASLGGSAGLAFEGHGNLWVANLLLIDFTSNVVEFAASQLMASGAPTPTVTISSAGGAGLAFAP